MKRLCPRRLGSLVHANARRLSLLLCLVLLILCAAINSGKLDVDLSSWVQRTSRVESELKAIETAIGDGAGSNSMLIFQTPKHQGRPHESSNKLDKNENIQGVLLNSRKKSSPKLNHINKQEQDSASLDEDEQGKSSHNILSVESMMIHLEALAIAIHTTIDMFDVSWSLKDICLAPTPPDYEGLLVNQMLDHLMPCVIKTPLDCFWEGAKLLGPEQDVRLSSIGPKLKWTNLNPMFMIELQQRNHPHATFPYQTLLDWMRRVGITNGYLDRPCLDPSDPNCPASAPNKLSGESPNIGHLLTGGCKGLATKQMHWQEEELVGGAVKNGSGIIESAEALQSTVLLMGERDVYDYWRKTSKVQDINNWSTEKAKLVLDSWQKRYKEELAQFSRSSMPSNSFKIHALTPKSILEPINDDTVLDLTNFKLVAIVMTVITCIAFPKFARPNELDTTVDDSPTELKRTKATTTTDIDRFRTLLLALCISVVVIMTFIASLGLSSFINLPFNMATTQILPPLALFYGFRQALMIANTYSKHFKSPSTIEELTTECMTDLMPIIVMECTTFIIPLIVATAFPVQATRVFTLQAITHILLSTVGAVLLIPSLLTIFLQESVGSDNCYDETFEIGHSDGSISRSKSRSRSVSPGVLSIISKKGPRRADRVSPSIDEQIFSRLQDDLKHIKSDQSRATDLNFSARFGPDGLKTSFSLRTGAGHAEYRHHHHHHHASDLRLDEQKTPEPSLGLPDLLLRSDSFIDDEFAKIENQQLSDEKPIHGTKDEVKYEEDGGNGGDVCSVENRMSRFKRLVIANKAVSPFIIAIKIIVIVAMLSQSPRVKFGLHLRDLLLKGTDDYESFSIRERYFPVYNIFAITRGGLDYPSQQKLLYEFHERISNVDGVLGDGSQNQVGTKFWLSHFRDWLMELQESFDQDRNKSAISKDGWTDDASDSAKLAYKLLAQTGKIDNPVDKERIETNRLVDKNGIINQRAFYYYLTAWVMNDAFTYSNSEADFRPEPKTWNENPNDLRIERARPLTFAQIPFLLRLPEDKDNMKSISEIRTISQKFEQIDLPNFPTGIPFIFWDQFVNLDYLFYTALAMIAAVLYLLIGLAFGNFIIAAILILPTIATTMEIYFLLGYLSVPFNSIIGVLTLSVIGLITAHGIHIITSYELGEGNPGSRVGYSMRCNFRTVITSLILLASAGFVFSNSKIGFMIMFSRILLYIVIMSAFNSLFLTPSLLVLFVSDNVAEEPSKSPSRSPIRSPKMIIKTIRGKKLCKQSRKNRGYPRVQSEISLSTISEEPQSEAQTHDLKLNFSIRC